MIFHGTQIWEDLYLMAPENVAKDTSYRLTELREKSPTTCRVFEAVMKLLFKGKYYSTSRNFATVLNELRITSEEYNSAIWKLEEMGILREVETRVYELTYNMHIRTQKEIDKLKKDEQNAGTKSAK